MNNFIKKYFPLLLSISIFLSFGLYHLTKFETIDEHFWKYGRIEKYFQGWQEKNLKKTRINDKPGVTVALISGLGLPFSPDPLQHKNTQEEQKFLRPKKNGYTTLYSIFKTEQTPKINLSLRLPLLLFNGLIMLPLIFYLLSVAFNKRIATLSTIFIATNPILIGISQIINPDALLWSFSATAIFAFLSLLKTGQKKFIFLTGLLTGLSLLSKYTANILFVFYGLLFLMHTISRPKNKFSPQQNYPLILSIITLVSWLTFIIFMPATLINIRYFFYGTTASPVFTPLWQIILKLFHLNSFISPKTIPFYIISLFLFALFFIFLPSLLTSFFQKYPKPIFIVLKLSTGLLILLFLLSFFNAWSDTSLFSLDNLKETSRSGGKLTFPQFSSDPSLIFWSKALLVQAQNFIFSLQPLTILCLFLTSFLLLTAKKIKYSWFIYFTAFIPFIFFIGGLLANIFVNVRYGLMLYVPFAILTALGLSHCYDKLKIKFPKLSGIKPTIAGFIFILVIQLITLWNIKPFYFNYTNFILPQKYLVTDSWGYGYYEAAQYLNSLPNAQDLIVWVDRKGLCQFFVGKCIRSSKIYIDYAIPDYLLISRRGSLIKHPTSSSEKGNHLDVLKYFQPPLINQPAWQLHIANRPQNFIKLIKVKESESTK
jgi:4-amino-4-deoxy-L-arabinose transferase-like glycosyltransferase